MPETLWAIILHGGALTIAPEAYDRNRSGCLAAVARAAEILRGGGSALDAAELAVRLLEDDATYNAGTGAVPNSAGELELDAAVMDGTTLDVGAVAALRGISNPVHVARALLRERTVLLVGEGAQAFARGRGFEVDVAGQLSRSDKTVGAATEHDTVGCVALDRDGHVAVATSTGGVPGQAPGRVGDAPIPGGGFYADDSTGGVAISGDGESILRSVLAYRVNELLRERPAAVAAVEALRALGRVGGEAGIVALGTDGHFGIAHNSDHFSVAMSASWLKGPRAGIHHTEFGDIVNG